MANSQIAAGILKALHDQHTATQYAQNPAAFWHSVGGTLPPGVSAAQFAGRIASSPLHKAIVAKSTGHGQIGVLDDNPCGACIAFVQVLLDGIGATGGIVGGGIASALIPGFAEWIAAMMASGNAITIGTLLGTISAGTALAICKHTGKC